MKHEHKSHSYLSFVRRVAAVAETTEIATGIVAVGTEAGVVGHLLTVAAIPKTIGEATMDTAEQVRSSQTSWLNIP
jgi:hypothetical protein